VASGYRIGQRCPSETELYDIFFENIILILSSIPVEIFTYPGLGTAVLNDCKFTWFSKYSLYPILKTVLLVTTNSN
jgi:hypothetical protein